MQFDIQKAFPYPVLRPFSDDYMESEFQANAVPSLVDEGSGIQVDVTFALSSDEIRDAISAGRACYATVIQCRDTYFRETRLSDNEGLRLRFQAGDFRGAVEVYSFVVAVKEIDDFRSDDINSEFGSGPFRFQPGQVLAMDQPAVFYFDRDLFKPVSSVFDLISEKEIHSAEWYVRLDEEHVQIAVSEEFKEVVDNARNTKANQSVLINSLYFGAVMQAIQALKDTDDYNERRWAKVIRQQCHNSGLELDAHDSYLIAQKLLKEPLALLRRYVFAGDEE